MGEKSRPLGSSSPLATPYAPLPGSRWTDSDRTHAVSPGPGRGTRPPSTSPDLNPRPDVRTWEGPVPGTNSTGSGIPTRRTGRSRPRPHRYDPLAPLRAGGYRVTPGLIRWDFGGREGHGSDDECRSSGKVFVVRVLSGDITVESEGPVPVWVESSTEPRKRDRRGVEGSEEGRRVRGDEPRVETGRVGEWCRGPTTSGEGSSGPTPRPWTCGSPSTSPTSRT